MKRFILLFSSILLLLSACQKAELPVPKADRGAAITTSFDLGKNYSNQIWFKLNGNKIISKNSRSDWDLAFESGEKGNHVLLNSAKFMFASNTHKQNFSGISILDTIGFSSTKQCDRPSTIDSSVIGIFENNSSVYIIDLGVDEDNKPIGLKKLQFVENTMTKFKIQYANLDGSNFHAIEFSKDNNYNYLHFSMAKNFLQTGVGARKEAYDLEFTQYTFVFDQPTYLPYLVQGVLINHSNVLVSKIKGIPYEALTLNDTLRFPLSSKQDAIGFDWKTYDFATGIYTITNTNNIINTYIIKDAEGYYYKLRFIDFYTGAIKGFPKFEYQKL